MIDVSIEMRANGLTDDILTQVLDSFADLENLCPDLLEWSVAATLGKQSIELYITIDSDDPNQSITRATEIVWLAVKATGGDFTQAVTEKVSAELVDA